MADARTSPGSRVVPRVSPDAQRALDVTLGLAGMTVGAAVVAVRTAHRVTAPVTRLLWRPPLLPRSLHPATILEEAARTGRAEQVALRRRFEVLLDAWAPVLVEAVVERIDLTRLVREHVDLDALVASVDLDAAVARVDLDAIAATLDVDAVVARADLDAAVARVDIEAILDRVDLDAIAATLDVDAVVARADLDRVIARIDIVRIVEEVLDAIDLPAIIRDSTGSMASETVRGVRMTGVSADDALSRVVDRALFRRRHPERPGGPA
ncbi:MAG TPA: hypothetical protein PLX57_05605 [Ornithinibacter sp.]|nr:hypothetical protein [Ornithinibacter sp.]HQX87625.1 hypothetical protein [Ornithinibacter sp.]